MSRPARLWIVGAALALLLCATLAVRHPIPFAEADTDAVEKPTSW